MPSLSNRVQPPRTFRVLDHQEVEDRRHAMRREMAREIHKLQAQVDNLKEQLASIATVSHAPAANARAMPLPCLSGEARSPAVTSEGDLVCMPDDLGSMPTRKLCKDEIACVAAQELVSDSRVEIGGAQQELISDHRVEIVGAQQELVSDHRVENIGARFTTSSLRGNSDEDDLDS